MSARTWVDIAYALEREDELRCRYGHRSNGCELGHPGCVCADEAMADCTGQCLPDSPGPNVCDCQPRAHQGESTPTGSTHAEDRP